MPPLYNCFVPEGKLGTTSVSSLGLAAFVGCSWSRLNLASTPENSSSTRESHREHQKSTIYHTHSYSKSPSANSGTVSASDMHNEANEVSEQGNGWLLHVRTMSVEKKSGREASLLEVSHTQRVVQFRTGWTGNNTKPLSRAQLRVFDCSANFSFICFTLLVGKYFVVVA